MCQYPICADFIKIDLDCQIVIENKCNFFNEAKNIQCGLWQKGNTNNHEIKNKTINDTTNKF